VLKTYFWHIVTCRKINNNISNYWRRLSRIWRILQVEESVIHQGQRPRWITPSEICRITHILWKPNSLIALLFIQNIFFAQTCKLYSQPFLSLLNDTSLCPGFLGQWVNNLWRQWFNNLQWAALLTSCWRQWFNNLQRTALLTSLTQYDRILGQQQLFMVNYVCGFNQLETGKYFEWTIINSSTIGWGLCDKQNNQGLGNSYQPRPSISQKLNLIIIVLLYIERKQ